MTSFVSDLRHALRQLRRSPGFAAAVVVTLALGIGANATMFGLVDRVLLRPFPEIPEVERVVEVASRVVSHPAYGDFREHAEGIVEVAGYRNRTFAVGDGSRTELATTLIVSGNYFQVLGARPSAGRLLTDADDAPEAPPVAVVSHGYWQQALGGDPDIVGRALTVNGRPVTVVGVAAPETRGTRVLYRPDLWVPMATWPVIAPSGFAGLSLERRTWNWITLVGRLEPGVSVAQAEAALNAGAARQRELHPDQTPTGYSVTLTPLLESATGLADRGAVVGFLGLLAAVTALVLLMACANVASLLIARTAAREEELGVRGALGASRGRLIRQFLTEALVFAALGTVTAVGVAAATGAALRRFSLPGGIALQGLDLGIDARVIGCAAVVGALACAAFGVVPAWHASRRRPGPMLRGGGDPRRPYRLRASLLAGQVALCLVLLVGTGLFARSLRNAMAEEPGFRTRDLLFAGVNLGLARYDPAAAEPFYLEVAERVAALPGVEAATWALTPPLMDGGYSESFTVDGYEPAPDEQLEAEMNAVGPGFFQVLDIPIVSGRAFGPADRADEPFVAVINETMAERYFQGLDPVGHRLGLVGRDAVIVGVARDVAYDGLGQAPGPYVYVPLAQVLGLGGLQDVVLIAHGPGRATGTLPAIRDAIAAADPAVPISALADIGDLYADVLLPQRLGAALLAAFGALALSLALVGVYGVVRFVVAQRRREIGIRVALGAKPGAVVRLALQGALVAVGAGVVVGLALAAAASGVAAQFLFGVAPVDPATYAAAAALLLAATGAAAFGPARGASRVDPTEALRHD
jgi:putative ABC transport system permease protein